MPVGGPPSSASATAGIEHWARRRRSTRSFATVLSHGGYDVEVDTSVDDPQACARRIAEHVAAARPEAFRRLRAVSVVHSDSNVPPPMACRVGCGACCIALSISSPIPGMPGQAFGRALCALIEITAAKLFGRPERPRGLCPPAARARNVWYIRREALAYLYALEAATRPRD